MLVDPYVRVVAEELKVCLADDVRVSRECAGATL
jgi:hypothetical protein